LYNFLSNQQQVTSLEMQVVELDGRCTEYRAKIRDAEQLRRNLHNQVMDLRGSIRVGCRVRPVLSGEEDQDASKAYAFPDVQFEQRKIDIKINQERFDRTVSKIHTFEFDRVFGPSSTQSDVYEEIAHMVQSAVDGYNVCIFAYGQTGSGKTHTMMGGSNSPLQGAERGMMPRAAEHIFSYCQELREQGWTFDVTATMVEIYCEQIRDLTPSSIDSTCASQTNRKTTHTNKTHRRSSSCDLKHVRTEEGGWDTEITNTNTLTMESTEDVLRLLDSAMAERATSETNCNARSSRSHTVLTLRIVGVDRDGKTTRKGQLHLIDLAGSERLSVSGSAKDPKLLKETQNINSSLSCLGNVIGALARNRNGHIPYRDSKLTHLLQHSLGGDSKALMFCNVSPVQRSLNESLTSLWFAEKVNQVARK
jgi:kinesin family member C1